MKNFFLHSSKTLAILNRGRWTLLLVPACLIVLVSGCASLRPHPATSGKEPGRTTAISPMLAAQVDLDYVYDADSRQQEKNQRLLVQRMCTLGLNTVLLQAFADPDGNDGAEELYFPNHALPMRRDLFAGTAALLQQCGLKVYAWLPMLAFAPGPGKEDLLVRTTKPTTPSIRRLSPFNPRAKAIIRGIYEDLARSAPLDGILFHDDAMLSDFEDASPAALAAYEKAGFPADISRIRQNSALMARWSRFKTKALITLSRSLLDIVRRYHPQAKSGRDLYARTILQPASEQWFAQSLPLFLQAYDYTFVLAMPFMENAPQPDQWLKELADKALAATVDPASLVFELQTVDWRRRQKITTAKTMSQLQLLRKGGIDSFAYYPDDFLQNHPRAKSLQQFFARIPGNRWRCRRD